MVSATENLCHDEQDLIPADPIEAVLAWHAGDSRAAIETLLADCAFLRDELVVASALLSRGIGRGWMPKLERA